MKTLGLEFTYHTPKILQARRYDLLTILDHTINKLDYDTSPNGIKPVFEIVDDNQFRLTAHIQGSDKTVSIDMNEHDIRLRLAPLLFSGPAISISELFTLQGGIVKDYLASVMAESLSAKTAIPLVLNQANDALTNDEEITLVS